eukprot:Em0001g2606a
MTGLRVFKWSPVKFIVGKLELVESNAYHGTNLLQLCRREEDEDLLDPELLELSTGVQLSDCTHHQGQQVGSAFTPRT